MNDYRKGYADGLRAALELVREISYKNDTHEEVTRVLRILTGLAHVTDPEGD